ncbi:NADH-quinone oxidoreductase subunit L [Leeia aquatica]|uniref:NADH-quinone oxidoreductase subunit L n=1 Tax=Leeia aquatica TaxID=2725557 RepID=A0A847S4J0_9NEIS|nr:NADH-quinone oxidoreductase subunit L [Leeia aquatica]NLR74057.1 NADH-quinone oxidoreductase subunit L [Leeia aquatica]
MQNLYLLVPLAPLVGALLAGLFGKFIGRAGAHTVTILGVLVAFVLSAYVLHDQMTVGKPYNGTVYQWLTVDGISFQVGFLIDRLTAMMMVVVTFVSLMVHLYTVGYMEEDPGYQRFFSYISLFTFAMLMLVMANNFVQLFFGWEAVGLVSYLLIGFWYKKPTAIFANLKAFLVNRVGDFGFVLGIGLVLAHFGSLDYADVFRQVGVGLPAAEAAAHQQFWQGVTLNLIGSQQWPLMAVICILLFVGAMGKSAQFPLHVWLPDSMEGPTPISALIHAATMVTAGIFMVARMSPLFELSDVALNVVLVVGAITALFMGFLGIIQNDIKRVVAYSTLSQLGYMTVALGASAYSVAVFHLMTHAFFKALLFLAAGSVIIGMHHDQDIRNMGGLRKYMKWTWITSLIGSLALIGTPFLSGFYSKDSIIEAVHMSDLPGAHFAYFAVIVGVFVTAFYSFRMYFLVFHGEERFRHVKHDDHHGHDDHHHGGEPHESRWVVTLPLVLLAVPSLVIGYLAIEPMLYGNFFDGVIYSHGHHVMTEMKEEFEHAGGTALAMGLSAVKHAPFWLALAGVALSWFFYLKAPSIPARIKQVCAPLYRLLENKYYLDDLYFNVFARGARGLGWLLWKVGDVLLIDGLVVNGSAKLVGLFSRITRRAQTGLLNHYALVMILASMVAITYWFSQLLFKH